MNAHHGKRAWVLACALAAAGAAVAWAGSLAPAGAAPQGMASRVGAPGARGGPATGAARPAGSWGRAIQVPGLGALNTGGNATVSSVSCGTAGNCAAAGDYTDRHDQAGGFAVSQRYGHWGKAIYVPGLRPASDVGVEVDSVSCARAYGCAAVGTYGEAYGTGFAAAEHHHRWGRANDLIGGGRFAAASTVSCAPAGNCAAGGDSSDDTGGIVQGAVVVERHGRWGAQTGVPGLKALNKGGDAGVTTVTCPPAGRCAAGGYYLDRHGHYQAFVTY